MITLDSHDYRILTLLQKDAGLSIAQIMEHVNLSSNACWRRIRNLETEGYILQRVALLNSERLECGTTVFVMVRAAEHSDEWLQSFSVAVTSMPEVVEFYRMSGDVDYLLKVKVAGITAYDAFYKRLIRTVRLTDVSSSFAMEEVKYSTAIPLPRR